jgi:hypothetical protein
MRGDFSRFGFDPGRSFSRVLIQQARMTLDYDANEQQSLNLHALRALAADLIGRHGGAGTSFQLTNLDRGGRTHLMIAPGRYYVDGWMAENVATVGYLDVAGEGEARVQGQPFFPAPGDPKPGGYLAYLEVWERAVSAAALDPLGLPTAPEALREVALGGPDTAARAQLVWQVRLHPAADLPRDAAGKPATGNIDAIAERIFPSKRGRLSAEAAKPPIESDNPCEISPRSRFRGIENQLYRIEIASGGPPAAQGGATFVWSRENGAVEFPIDHVAGEKVKLTDVWRDARFALAVEDIVEIVTDASGLGDAPSFRRVEDWDPDSATVTLDSPPDAQSGGPRRPLLIRRWDHGRRRSRGDGSAKMAPQNTLLIEEGKPLTIEEGITIRFEPPVKGENIYRPGDYWLIPARVALGDILWPRTSNGSTALPPHGIERHFAPLALVEVGGDGKPSVTKDLRNRIDPLAKPAS